MEPVEWVVARVVEEEGPRIATATGTAIRYQADIMLFGNPAMMMPSKPPIQMFISNAFVC